MKKHFFLIATASMAAYAAPAAAQDDSPFTGPRVEALVGYDMTRPGSTTDIDNADEADQTINDIAYGVGLGYDFDMGSLVLGIEGEYVQSQAQTEFDTVGFTDFGVGNIEAGRDLYVGLRAGVQASPNMLVYGKAGYSNARYNYLATDNTTDVETDLDLDGWRAGAGLEYAMDNGLFLKGEYRYTNYKEGEVEAPSGLESDRFDVDLDRHQVMAGVGYRF